MEDNMKKNMKLMAMTAVLSSVLVLSGCGAM
ncbi:TPA: conjugal transfer protein TraT, partial [Escherichia coli]|nr:conjugal transfer protein TraT [Escherichia coli]HCP7628133.1 conjugal transfer protein TraT [Escherichia coli]